MRRPCINCVAVGAYRISLMLVSSIQTRDPEGVLEHYFTLSLLHKESDPGTASAMHCGLP